jgi:hypothetical protein
MFASAPVALSGDLGQKVCTLRTPLLYCTHVWGNNVAGPKTWPKDQDHEMLHRDNSSISIGNIFGPELANTSCASNHLPSARARVLPNTFYLLSSG